MADASHLDAKLNFSTAFAKVLDKRILKALGEMGFARPTMIQAQAIPIALEGRDILARARTGSGKTAAYCIPVVQKILQAKSATGTISAPMTRALILVPTKELAEQVSSYLRQLLIYCDKTIKVSNVAGSGSGGNNLQKMLLADVPDIIVGTPTRILALLNSKTITLSYLETLIIDEADLILSYGHDVDVRTLLSSDTHLPKVYQRVLMSATMTEDVRVLKGLVLRDPAIIKLEETKDEAASLAQYFVRCSEPDKFLLTYVILKLRLVQGKCILFTNSVDRSYRLKLFLEQFGIKSCVLNAEMPINSRFHVVQEFNRGVYDYIIASDESAGSGDGAGEDDRAQEEEGQEASDEEDQEDEDEDENAATEEPSITSGKKRKQSPVPSSQPTAKRPKPSVQTPDDDDDEPTPSTSTQSTSKKNPKRRKGPGAPDREFGVSRGIDFIDVSCVLNFDLPTTSSSYTHRIGRTARAGRSGLSISFVVPSSLWGKDKIVSCETAKNDEKVWKGIREDQGARGAGVREYEFDKRQVEAFRYRMEDALRSVTRAAVKEARIKELKSEILKSDKLKAHFEDHPLDLEYLRHDKPLRPTRIQAHMKHVPKYLVPRIAAVPSTSSSLDPATPEITAGTVEAGSKDVGFVPFKKQKNHGQASGKRGGFSGRGGAGRGGGGGGKGKKSDPLRKFGK